MSNIFARLFQQSLDDTLTIPTVEAQIAEVQPKQSGIGAILADLGLKVVHFRTEDPTNKYGPLGSARNTTVVYRPRDDVNHTIEVATAVCSENDAFDRRHGAQLALSRFMTGQRVSLPPRQYKQTDYELLQGFFA